MNKQLRIALALIVLVGLVLAAGFQTAWANKSASTDVAWSASAALETTGESTLGAPGCDSEVLVDAEITSMCGIATIVSNNGQEVGRSYVGNRPDGFKSKKVIVDLNGAGSAQLCFAAKNGGVIYFYNPGSETWQPMLTTVDHGIACTQITESGDYVLGK